jgi:hypothetical protein
MIFRFLVGFVFALSFSGLIPGLHLNNQPAIFPIGFVKIVQGENAPMGASLAAYLLPSVLVIRSSHEFLLKYRTGFQTASLSETNHGPDESMVSPRTNLLVSYNHSISTTPRPHPPVGVYLSPPVGGDQEMKAVP